MPKKYMNTKNFALIYKNGLPIINQIKYEKEEMVYPDGEGGFRDIKIGDYIDLDCIIVFIGTKQECENYIGTIKN